MHREVRLFVQGVASRFPEHFTETKVLEFGARNINGDVRDLFAPSCEITGVDCVNGPNVDHVCLCHDFHSTTLYDVVFCTEMLEHDPHWRSTLESMYRLTKGGGLVFLTCATEGRSEHGTTDRPYHIGTAEGPDPRYYRNLTERDIMQVFTAEMFQDHRFHVQRGQIPGLFFWGIRGKKD